MIKMDKAKLCTDYEVIYNK